MNADDSNEAFAIAFLRALGDVVVGTASTIPLLICVHLRSSAFPLPFRIPAATAMKAP
jgi:hypothetical protein